MGPGAPEKKLNGMNMGRRLKISAAHMTEGFYYICKPQWEAGKPVMSPKEIMNQYVLMRLLTSCGSQGVPIDVEQGYAWLHAELDKRAER